MDDRASNRQRRTHTARSDSGAAAVEFALVAPILILLLVGMLQFGLVFNRWLQLEHAAREGVRWASLRNPAADVRQHTEDASALDSDDLTIEITPPDPMAAAPNTPAIVVVRMDVPVFTPLMSAFLGDVVHLTASATQRIE